MMGGVAAPLFWLLCSDVLTKTSPLAKRAWIGKVWQVGSEL